MAGPELTPDLLAQLEKDAAWFAPDENPYRLGIEGERTIDGEEEDADEMTIYGAMDDGASYEVATFHVDDMAPHAVRIFAALPALVAAAKERGQLREAVRLRDYATLEAWSGVAAGLEAAAHATAQAEVLEKLAGVVAPTAEQQRDAAFGKVAATMVERNQLRAEVERLTAERDLWARDRDEATAERDTARQLADKREEEQDALQAEVERLRGLGLEAVKVLDRAGIVTNFRALIGDPPARDFDPFAPADRLPADVLADVETERGMRAKIERKP